MQVLRKEQIKQLVNEKESNFNKYKNELLVKYKTQKQELDNRLKVIEDNQTYLIQKELVSYNLLEYYDFFLTYHIRYDNDGKAHFDIMFKNVYDDYALRGFEFTLFVTVTDNEVIKILNTDTGAITDIDNYIECNKIIELLNSLDWRKLAYIDNLPKYKDYVTVDNPYDLKCPNYLKEVYSNVFNCALEMGDTVEFEEPEYLDNAFVESTIERYVVGKSGDEYYLQTAEQKRNRVPFVEIFDVSQLDDISFLRGDYK